MRDRDAFNRHARIVPLLPEALSISVELWHPLSSAVVHVLRGDPRNPVDGYLRSQLPLRAPRKLKRICYCHQSLPVQRVCVRLFPRSFYSSSLSSSSSASIRARMKAAPVCQSFCPASPPVLFAAGLVTHALIASSDTTSSW